MAYFTQSFMSRTRYAQIQDGNMGWNRLYTAITDYLRGVEVMAAFGRSLKSLDASKWSMVYATFEFLEQASLHV